MEFPQNAYAFVPRDITGIPKGCGQIRVPGIVAVTAAPGHSLTASDSARFPVVLPGYQQRGDFFMAQ